MTDQPPPLKVVLERGKVLVSRSDRPYEVIAFTPQEWREFLAGAKDGEFDQPEGGEDE